MKKVLALVVLSLASASALAGPLLTGSQTQTFSFADLDATTVLSFNGFNSALGVLNSVHFSYTLNETLDSIVLNTNPGAKQVGIPVKVTATATTTFTGTGIAAMLSGVYSLTTAGYTGVVPGGFSLTTVGTATVSGVTGSTCLSNDSSCGAGNTDLSGYVGGVNLFTVNIASVGTQGGSVPRGVFTGNDGTASGTVSISYDYTARTSIPEPANLGLMGLGLVGIATIARRKTKQAA